MPTGVILTLTFLSMTAFAANSLLCRLALSSYGMDAASFTTIRLASGAIALWILMRARRGACVRSGDWTSGFALFAYAAGFSRAYSSLSAAAGALLLFTAVQASMLAFAIRSGESISLRQWAGFLSAFAGLATLLFPGLSAPSLSGSALMLIAGMAWAVYTLRGQQSGSPGLATAGNFLRSVPFAVILSFVAFSEMSLSGAGVACAVISGALASGIGYMIWYKALYGLNTASAAVVQLSVPVLTAFGGTIFLGETLTMRFLIASITILGGIALTMTPAVNKRRQE